MTDRGFHSWQTWLAYSKSKSRMTPMLRRIAIILFFCTSTLGAFGQCTDSTILLDRIDELCRESSSWSYGFVDEKIVLTYNGNFTTNTILGAKAVTKKELRKPSANSISFAFITSDGWNDSTYMQTKNNNAHSLQILMEQYANHYDSVGWPPKHSYSTFKRSPMKYLKHFNLKSESVFSSVVPLPDFRIHACGVWIEPSLDLSTYYIVQTSVGEEIDKVISRIVSLDIYVNQALDGRKNY